MKNSTRAIVKGFAVLISMGVLMAAFWGALIGTGCWAIGKYILPFIK